jgi:DNA polymerase III delta prime subunit
MKNDDTFYRLVCETVDLIVLVKKLTPSQEKKLFKYVKRLMQDIDAPLSISKYERYILSRTLVDPTEFFSKLPKDTPDSLRIIHAVYETILQVYPLFDLHLLCSNLNNNEVLLSSLPDIFRFLEGADLDSDEKLEIEFENTPRKFNSKRISTIEDIERVEKFFKRNIVGQDEAIASIISTLKVIASGLDKRSALFFVGPTGVGKTELARLLGKRYSGNFMKINCAEFASAHEYAKLIGAPPGYVGHGEKSMLAEKAEKSNRWVFLFDEVEKAHHKLFDFLLSLLDEGKVCDNLGHELDFSESIFVFTSNQGVSDIRGGKRVGFSEEEVTYEQSRQQVKESIKKKFPPEFINRVDSFVYFNSLTKKDCLKIARLSLKDIPIKKHKALLHFIVKNGYSVEYGARNIKRFVKNTVGVKVAEMILDKKIPNKDGDLYTPKITSNFLQIVNTMSIKNRSRSYINDISGT